MPQVSALFDALNARFPFSRAESWDKTGLQIGDANAEIASVFVAYEITDAVLDAAEGSHCLAVYHPLLFRPIENLDFKNHTARLAGRILRQNQHLLVAHTALDGASPPHALGDALAAQLGLSNVRVLKPSGHQELVKIAVFVPLDAVDSVLKAMWDAGAGSVGNYDQASFQTRGMGTFRPLEGAKPAIGRIGQREIVEEKRLEVIASREMWPAVVAAMKTALPYEEVAFDVLPLLNAHENQSFGPARLGEVARCEFDDFATLVQNALQAPNLRLVRGSKMVQNVACCPGSGASFIAAAARAGADVLVSGDIKHHDALQARALGLSIIDVTHAATERATISLLADALNGIEGLDVRRGELENPFS